MNLVDSTVEPDHNESQNIPRNIPSIHHPITINNNIPESKLFNEQSYNIPTYVSSLIILILGCLTLNPWLLLLNPCLNNNAEHKTHKQAIMLKLLNY